VGLFEVVVVVPPVGLFEVVVVVPPEVLPETVDEEVLAV